MEEITKIRELYKLKNIDRFNSVKNRKESSAEHSWSCLILADYFLNKTKMKINRLRVYELLMYHDVIEIEAGDTVLHPDINSEGKEEREANALKTLKEQIPSSLKTKYVNLFKEFEEGKTIEAKFAKAIDQLDAIIQELDYKKDWKGWSEKFLRDKKEKYFLEFPEIRKSFEIIIAYVIKEGYFNQ